MPRDDDETAEVVVWLIASISFGYWMHSVGAGLFIAMLWFLAVRLKNG